MSNQNSKKYKISPEEYSKYIADIEIVGIRHEKGSFELKNINILNKDSSINVKYGREASLVEKYDDGFVVRDSYKFSASEKLSKKRVVSIKCSFIIVYQHPLSITEDIFEVFGDLNVPINTWPYFREFIHSSSCRMGLPPFTLPALNTAK